MSVRTHASHAELQGIKRFRFGPLSSVAQPEESNREMQLPSRVDCLVAQEVRSGAPLSHGSVGGADDVDEVKTHVQRPRSERPVDAARGMMYGRFERDGRASFSRK